MKKEIINFRNMAIIMFIAAGIVSCNNGSETRENEEDSFFDSMLNHGRSTDLEIASADISSNLENLQGELLRKDDVKEFYKNRNNSAVWTNTDFRNSFYDELKEAHEEGLQFKDYHGNELQILMNDPASKSPKERAKLEILLTDAFFEYGNHLYYGKLDPAKMYKYWGVIRESQDFKQDLGNAANKGSIEQVLADLKPSQQIYSDLKQALKEYEELKNQAQTTFTKIEEGEELIKPGEKDDRIPSIVQRLKELEAIESGYTSEENIYDRTLQEAVKEFQKQQGLQIDAVLGNSTIRELNMNAEDRYNQILANLERWRWYPRDLGGHYILINIPAFELAVVKDGDTIRQHNIIAGTKARPTHVFSDTLQYIVLNPEWTIPPTIKTQDVIPSAAANPSYLSNNNISVYSNDGEQLDPSSINWSGENVKNYTFVQEAGPSNPLGRIKIIYPNDYLIYLHDTPAKSLFQQNERAESSGCVRVENVLELSEYILQKQENWNLDRIHKIISTGKTTTVKIENPIQVHHFYWTAWRDKGVTVFTQDIYDLDREIYVAMQKN